MMESVLIYWIGFSCYLPEMSLDSVFWANVSSGRDRFHLYVVVPYGKMEPAGLLSVCQGRAAYVWVKYVLVLRSHALPDSVVSNPSFLPIFPLYLVSLGRDYTGLGSLPEADMHAFIH